ncbi:hypothetical protein PBRA_002271 [Plasmodiophora brassicae]|uniref:NodB homology domain-containing protein n=1 Tax=Plasmodiophora brassicae TaxID=37360 RepID=A0A0G4J3Z9_PLABS|nr:hypothetical protein PBRA_002271 [Plasmodiophora brassicae]
MLVPLIVLVVIVGIIMIIIYFTVIKPKQNLSNVGKWDPNRPIHSFNYCGNSKTIALTFDDGPDLVGTPNVLADLKALNVKATFFMSPSVNSVPTQQQCDLVKMILQQGHSVQSHSWDHTDFLQKTGQDVYNNLKTVYDWISHCSGQSPFNELSMFRPPFGSMNPEYAAFVSKLGYTLASWNVDSLDYSSNSPQQVYQNILSGFQTLGGTGSVITLMHDSHYIPGVAQGVLQQVVPYFKSQGYQFVTMPECYANCHQNVCLDPVTVWPGTWDTSGTFAASL